VALSPQQGQKARWISRLRHAVAMETILNLIWLAVTLAGLYVWRFRWFPSRGNQRERIFPEAVATLCLIALLFPVISLTDDLHPEIMIAECVSAKGSLSLIIAGGRHAHDSITTHHTHTQTALMTVPLTRMDQFSADFVHAVQILQTISSSDVRSARAPPSFL
jgi:hypothetical protein